jgi:hypothetical protein
MPDTKNLLIPICGKSTRFPNMRPKWMLTHPNGDFMVVNAILGLNLECFDNIYFVALKEHEKQYKFSKGLLENLKKYNLHKKTTITLLENPTDSQPHTIFQGIKKNKIEGFLFIKDCDNYFEYQIKDDENQISYCSLDTFDSINPTNKSYIQLDKLSIVENIIEKKIISTTFCSGGYGFKSAKDFCNTFEKLQKLNNNLYTSDIIYDMMLENVIFYGNRSKNYSDFGTVEDWNKYKSKFKTLFIDLDGTLVENSSQYLTPKVGESNPLQKNIDFLNKLSTNENTYIIITTSRPEKFRKVTVKELKQKKIPYNVLIMGLPHCQRIVINDFGPTNPFPSASSINLVRNTETLENYL